MEAKERDGPHDGQYGTHCISVSAPFIAIVPACARITISSDAEKQDLVIALTSHTLKDASRRAFGTADREVPRWFTAWDPFLSELVDTLVPLRRSRARRSRAADPALLNAFADVIALHLLCRYGRRVGAHDCNLSLTQHMLALIDVFIHEHIAELIQVAQLATLVHMSPSHFARAFKKATGRSPHFYVIIERLRFASSMLSEGRLPLTDVAARAGFQTQQHFTEVFHRYTGSTPRAFRLAHPPGSLREQRAF